VELTEQQLVAAGIPEPARVIAAAASAAWLDAVPPETVLDGLARAADPAGALHGLARLPAPASLALAPDEVRALLCVLGGSSALVSALAAEGTAWRDAFRPTLEEDRRDAAAHGRALGALGVAGPLPREVLQSRLRLYCRREQLRIGGRDLLGLATVDETVRELSALADAVIGAALASTRQRLAQEWRTDPPVAFVVLGMGKLGGGELNYSSDVDLIYVYERDGDLPDGRTVREFFVRVAEEVTRALAEVTEEGFCFRVDLRLRPGGGEGPLTLSLPALLSYYEALGQTWERAVWLKARAVAGDLALGTTIGDELMPFVYRRFLDYGMLEDLKEMKHRVDASLRDRRARERNVKLGRGGIRGVEFWVQAHQLIHGGKDPRLRERSTLGALATLAGAGYVASAQAASLAEAYRFLRDVEHKLQIAHQRQTQIIPSDPDELRVLVRRLGFLGPNGEAEFWRQHAAHTGTVEAAFAELFHGAEEERRRDERPELATLMDSLDREELALWQLGQLGFSDLEAVYRDLRLMRDGPPYAPALPRRRQALAALAPSLVADIAGSPEPDRALHHMTSFITTVGARTSYLHLLLENPGIRRLLVGLFATSEFLSNFFLRHPELLDSLVRADLVQVTRTRDGLARELAARMGAAQDFESELDILRRFRTEEFLRIGVHDIQGQLRPPGVSEQLSSLAEVCLKQALGLAWRDVTRRLELPPDPPTEGLAVLAMGKLGGAELNYHSDLDLIFVYDAGAAEWWRDRIAPHEFFTRVAQRAMSVLQTPTREGVAYRIDTRLRPSGNQGPLVSSLESFEAYHRTSAQLWERQALIKARPVEGPAALRARLEKTLTRFVYGRGLDRAGVAEVRSMRERIASERDGADGQHVNIKTGRGGLFDVEFVVQMLQLEHGYHEPRLRVRSTRRALMALEATRRLAAEDARALREGYDFLRALEGRLRIERDQPVEAFDTEPDAMRGVARRLGYKGSDEAVVAALRADHERHRGAIRAAYDRAFAAALGSAADERP
jgi:[glutamine synthetase] adenylyltransferase / [glutamine synthetase]-adenylyl-L-tyrosine phosphorylase